MIMAVYDDIADNNNVDDHYNIYEHRDRLRLEAQSSSKDEYSRNAALLAQTSGQSAVFDPNQKSDGLALTCGNHCAMKVGTGHCCSCRSMLPIRTNTYVYLEFSVTVSGNQVPTLCVGLAPPDCPLNVMVGSWPRSVGLFSDGQLLVDSRWFPDIKYSSFIRPPTVTAGTTMGVLVHLRDPSSDRCDNDSALLSLSHHHPSTPKATVWSLFNYFVGISDEVKKATFSPVVIHGKKDILLQSGTMISDDSRRSEKERREDKEVKDEKSRTKSENKQNNEDLLPKAGDLLQKNQMEEEIPTSTEKGQLQIKWNINGQQSKYSSNALDTVSDIDSLKAPLYPTVSLLSEDTRVWCRFCEADIVYRDRGVVGAPKGVRVYCLDGSLLLDEND